MDDPFNITFEDVEKTAKAWDRIAIRLPGHCVIILDEYMVGDGWILSFDDTPHGWNQARCFAVRLADEDIESKQPLEELEAQYHQELGF